MTNSEEKRYSQMFLFFVMFIASAKFLHLGQANLFFFTVVYWNFEKKPKKK